MAGSQLVHRGVGAGPAPATRKVPPFGGYLIGGDPASPLPGSRISAAFGGAPVMDPYAEADLRRRQAEFGRVTREIDEQNSWFALPALAPEMAVGALDLLGIAGVEALGSGYARSPLNFPHREGWQKLPTAVRNALRAAARRRWADANGIKASELNAVVHHSLPLEWAHRFPDADPNRLAGLWGLRDNIHQIANSEWAAFSRALNGRIPTQAEIMAEKLRIDRLLAPYVQRSGIPRPPTPPLAD